MIGIMVPAVCLHHFQFQTQKVIALDFCCTECTSGEIRMLLGIPLGKQPHGRLRRKWRDNIEVYLRELSCELH
jgi:hypothetical protein